MMKRMGRLLYLLVFSLSTFVLIGASQYNEAYAGDLLAFSAMPQRNYIILVDKEQQSLNVFELKKDNLLNKVREFAASTGKSPGDKVKTGDLKTPEGIYFFNQILNGKGLPPRYGLRAFVTDYPNVFDQKRRKSGSGIWLHGIENAKELKPLDTKGCVAMRNEDLRVVSNYIKLADTPIIISDKIDPSLNLMDGKKLESVKELLGGWVQAWQTKDIQKYINYYSDSFRSNNMQKWMWYQYKKRLNEKYSRISVKYWNEKIYQFRSSMVVHANLAYESDLFQDSGVKILYLAKEYGDWKIVAEQWRPIETTSSAGRNFARK